MIAIVSYGLGNVRAFANVYRRHGVPVVIATSAEVLRTASHLILPGVGSFDWAMETLARSGLTDALNELAVVDERPILGVCVGMQMMMERSDEGEKEGLGWIRGAVRKLGGRPMERALRLPHMGWNDVSHVDDPLFAGMNGDASFYFLHSYHVVPKDAAAIAHTEYGHRFVCAVRKKNLVGVQFHPEKSHQWGERLLLNFASC